MTFDNKNLFVRQFVQNKVVAEKRLWEWKIYGNNWILWSGKQYFMKNCQGMKQTS